LDDASDFDFDAAVNEDRTDNDLRSSIPAYVEVGQFLVDLLCAELDSGRDDPVFDRYEDGEQIVTAFRSQMERYTRQRASFNIRDPKFVRLYDYYLALLADPDAAVFAVRPPKYTPLIH
jgi:hypothetical protein